MTNYRISESIAHAMEGALKQLLDRRIDMMRQDFVLDAGQVADACVPARARELLRQLSQMHITSVQTTWNYYAVAEFDYPVLLQLDIRPVQGALYYYCYSEQNSGYSARSYVRQVGLATANPKTGSQSYTKLPFDLSVLDKTTQAKMREWVNMVAKECRFADLTMRVVKEFLEQHGTTLYHLMARWPDLRLILPAVDKEWQSRIDSVPGGYKLQRWGWSDINETQTEWRRKNQSVMDLAGGILVSGMMLPKIDNKDPVTCTVVGWKIGDDKEWVFKI